MVLTMASNEITEVSDADRINYLMAESKDKLEAARKLFLMAVIACGGELAIPHEVFARFGYGDPVMLIWEHDDETRETRYRVVESKIIEAEATLAIEAEALLSAAG